MKNCSKWIAAMMLSGAALNSTTLKAQVPVLTNLFKVEAGAYYDLVTTGNNNRGIAINPVTGNVLYTSTAGGSNHVSVIDGKTGTYINALDATGVSGGTLALLGVRVAEDGAVYVMNLAAQSATLRVYRWESETDPNPPTTVLDYPGSPVRIGDAMDIRGKGPRTQIIAGGSAFSNPGNQFVLITPDPTDPSLTNSPWVPTFFNYPSELGAGDLGLGISFDGTNNAVFGKKGGITQLRHVAFDPAGPSCTFIKNINVGESALVGTKYYQTNGVGLLAGVVYGTGASGGPAAHRARVYSITDSANPGILLNELMPGPFAANGNGIGASDIVGDKVAFLEPNNGISVYSLGFASAVPPSILGQPVSVSNVLAHGYCTLSASAGGTAPLRYQWYHDGAALPGATTNNLDLNDLSAADSGMYTVTITNLYGRTNSTPAFVGVTPSAASYAAQPLWSKKPGDLFFLNADNSQRGLAYNPVSGNVLVVGRDAPTNGVHVLSAETGAYLRTLDMTGVGGIADATYQVNMIAVADDGAVYLCDLTVSGAGFTIYRWPDDSGTASPTIIYQDNPGVGRIGDTFSAAGAGVRTVLLAGSRDDTKVVAFTQTDGSTWTASIVDVIEAAPGFAGLGLFATATNSFWAKTGGQPLRKVHFDLANATHSVTVELSSGMEAINAIAVDEANSLVAGIFINETPNNLALFDVAGLTATNDAPALLDQDWFATSNPNLNGTGQIDFDFAGGRIFALNSNNGLLAAKYAPPLRSEIAGGKLVLKWAGPAVLTSSPNAAGPYVDVPAAQGSYTNTSTSTVFYRLRR